MSVVNVVDGIALEVLQPTGSLTTRMDSTAPSSESPIRPRTWPAIITTVEVPRHINCIYDCQWRETTTEKQKACRRIDQTQQNVPLHHGCSQARDTHKITDELPPSTKGHRVHCQLTLEREPDQHAFVAPSSSRTSCPRDQQFLPHPSSIPSLTATCPTNRPTDRLKMGESHG